MIIDKFKVITKSKFIRNVLTVASGAAGAHLVTILFTPIVTRLFTPEEFGLLGVFMAIAMVLNPISALTYPTAIVLPKTSNHAIFLARFSIFLSFLIAMVLLVSILILDVIYLGDTEYSRYLNLIYLVPLSMLLSAAIQILLQWLIRHSDYKVVAKYDFLHSIVVNFLKLLFGFIYATGFGLVFAYLLGLFFHASVLVLAVRKSKNSLFGIHNLNYNKEESKKVILEYRDFPIYRAPQVLINGLSQSLPILMLATFFGASAAGFYTLAKTVIGLPSALLGKAVGDVFYPEIARLNVSGGNIFPQLKKATVMLSIIGVLPFLFVFLYGGELFSVAFGENWKVAGEYSAWLSIWLYFAFVSTVSIQSIPVLGIQREFLIYTVVLIAMRACALYLGAVHYDPLGAVILFSLVGSLGNIMLIGYVLSFSKNKIRL